VSKSSGTQATVRFMTLAAAFIRSGMEPEMFGPLVPSCCGGLANDKTMTDSGACDDVPLAAPAFDAVELLEQAASIRAAAAASAAAAMRVRLALSSCEAITGNRQLAG
jgi:hypothetical protein